MTEQSSSGSAEGRTQPDPLVQAARIRNLLERARQLLAEGFVRRDGEDHFQIPDPAIIAGAFAEFAGRAAANPGRLAAAQLELWRDHLALWGSFTRKLDGETVEPLATPA